MLQAKRFLIDLLMQRQNYTQIILLDIPLSNLTHLFGTVRIIEKV